MIHRLWRQAHLGLAAVSFVFLLLVALSGAVLAISAVDSQVQADQRTDSWDNLTLAQALPVYQQRYAEISSLSVTQNGELLLDGFDADGNELHSVIHPHTGEVVGNPLKNSDFVEWVTTFHRSLFLHEPGRIFVGVCTFLFLLILLSGIALIVKRQGWLRFFGKMEKTTASDYWHAVAGRVLVIPLLISALTGTSLFMKRLSVIPDGENTTIAHSVGAAKTNEPLPIGQIPIFRNIEVEDMKSIDFPFSDDEADYYVLRLSDKELNIHQYTGDVVSEVRYPFSAILDELNLDLHTGRSSILWAVVLAIASLSVVFFICTGFAITIGRLRASRKSGAASGQEDLVLLVGSQFGNTMRVARRLAGQWQAQGKNVVVLTLNEYQKLPQASHLLIFTSTYGDGVAPNNAEDFEKLLEQYPQTQNIKFSVVGFGSRKFQKYCAFALKADQLLGNQAWAERLLPVHTVHMRSPEEFGEWAKLWTQATGYPVDVEDALRKE